MSNRTATAADASSQCRNLLPRVAGGCARARWVAILSPLALRIPLRNGHWLEAAECSECCFSCYEWGCSLINSFPKSRCGASMKEIFAYLFGLGLLGNAALFVPQAIAVWRKKSDEGVSLITFGGFSILQVVGIVHGVYQHDWSLTVGMAASLLTCGTVTLLTIFYRVRRLGA